jgi:O-Antigen ligase
MKPLNFEEFLIWYFILFTYVIYALGLLFPATALLAWVLFFLLIKKTLLQSQNNLNRVRISVSWRLWIWCISMLVILLATYIGIDDFELGANAQLRGTLGWLTTSAVFALFILSGCLNIRPQLIYRAVCILCLQSIIAIPIGVIAYQLKLPDILYSSPVERLIQNGPIFYNVGLYAIDYDTQSLRLFLFAPWCPALGLIGNIYFFLALEEQNIVWRYIGMIGAIAMSVVSVSRSAFVALPIVLVLIWLFRNLLKPRVQLVSGLVCFFSGIFSANLLELLKNLAEEFSSSRASSSRVRSALVRIALERSLEAKIWGHGTQDPGPKVVANLPIGSHHTWAGLLFAKGTVGLIAFMLPFVISLIDLLFKSYTSPVAKASLGVLLTLLIFSFGEQVDILGYLCFPGLILIGIALQEPNYLIQPFNSHLTPFAISPNKPGT